jgi:hypothetical protein
VSRKQYISGIPIGSHLDRVREFTAQPPKYISHRGRADSIYNWIGSVVRLKKRLWTGDSPVPYGIVIEVGPASWLAALWANSRDPREQVAPRDIDRWWPRNIYDLKNHMLVRKYSEEQLLQFLSTLDYPRLTRVS